MRKLISNAGKNQLLNLLLIATLSALILSCKPKPPKNGTPTPVPTPTPVLPTPTPTPTPIVPTPTPTPRPTATPTPTPTPSPTPKPTPFPQTGPGHCDRILVNYVITFPDVAGNYATRMHFPILPVVDPSLDGTSAKDCNDKIYVQANTTTNCRDAIQVWCTEHQGHIGRCDVNNLIQYMSVWLEFDIHPAAGGADTHIKSKVLCKR